MLLSDSYIEIPIFNTAIQPFRRGVYSSAGNTHQIPFWPVKPSRHFALKICEELNGLCTGRKLLWRIIRSHTHFYAEVVRSLHWRCSDLFVTARMFCVLNDIFSVAPAKNGVCFRERKYSILICVSAKGNLKAIGRATLKRKIQLKPFGIYS